MLFLHFSRLYHLCRAVILAHSPRSRCAGDRCRSSAGSHRPGCRIFRQDLPPLPLAALIGARISRKEPREAVTPPRLFLSVCVASYTFDIFQPLPLCCFLRTLRTLLTHFVRAVFLPSFHSRNRGRFASFFALFGSKGVTSYLFRIFQASKTEPPPGSPAGAVALALWPSRCAGDLLRSGRRISPPWLPDLRRASDWLPRCRCLRHSVNVSCAG